MAARLLDTGTSVSSVACGAGDLGWLTWESESSPGVD